MGLLSHVDKKYASEYTWIHGNPLQRSVVLLYSLCLWSTYREVDIGNWWSSCHKNLDNLCMSCPCCQVKWAGTLVVGAITRGFVAKQQLHDVSGIQKKKEWLKKELLDPNFFSSLWNSNTNASCIFFLLMDSEVGRGVARVYWKSFFQAALTRFWREVNVHPGISDCMATVYW